MAAIDHPLLLLLLLLLLTLFLTITSAFEIREATVDDIHHAFTHHELTSKQLVQFYLDQVNAFNPLLRAVIEVNPDALRQAEAADQERMAAGGFSPGGLHGVPVLLKDNIATDDELGTTAGSLALLGSVVGRDAGVVARLRRAGAVILGKASMSEWADFRGLSVPDGWCARAGQGKDPYLLSGNPCGSSSGSAIAVAANLAMVSLGTETDGSIICPASYNSVVGIKPTVGLTSRAGVIPITPRQDTVGPICRTVSDAVHVLEAIVGVDPRDAVATKAAAKFIPSGGYKQFLKLDGLKGKRLGILRKHFFDFPEGSAQEKAYNRHFRTLRGRGAILVDDIGIANVSSILNYEESGEEIAMLAEFKISLNSYLSELTSSPVRTLSDVIAFNNQHKTQEKIEEFGQEILLAAQGSTGIGEVELLAIENMERLSREGIERLMEEKKLDAIITPDSSGSSILAIGGYPGISVPAGYGPDGMPFGICFGGLRGSEPTLIEIAYSFEQATMIRKPPHIRRKPTLINDKINQH